MYVQGEYIQPGEKVLFVAKKDDSCFLYIGAFFLTAGIPLGLVALNIREELGIRMLLGFPFVFAVILTILAVRQYKKTKLVITDRRLLLSQGLFKIKNYNCPITEIEAVTDAGEIIFSDGIRISPGFIFDRKSIETLADAVERAGKRPGLTADIKARRVVIPTLPGTGEDISNGPEQIVYTCRKSKSWILKEVSIWIFLILLDILVAWTNLYSGSFFKLLGFGVLGFVLIAGLCFRLRKYKYYIVLTNKHLVIHGRIAAAGIKYAVSTKTIPLISIREVHYPDDLHVMLMNGEWLMASVDLETWEFRRLADHIAALKQPS